MFYAVGLVFYKFFYKRALSFNKVHICNLLGLKFKSFSEWNVHGKFCGRIESCTQKRGVYSQFDMCYRIILVGVPTICKIAFTYPKKTVVILVECELRRGISLYKRIPESVNVGLRALILYRHRKQMWWNVMRFQVAVYIDISGTISYWKYYRNKISKQSSEQNIV